MKKFPVKIDLSTFFEDERKFVIILVDPQWQSVERLQQRVEDIFDVRPVRFLTHENLFIPSQESIEVVEYTEYLKAFIPKHAVESSRLRRRSKHFENPDANEGNKLCGNNAFEVPVTEKPIKKRKYYTTGAEHFTNSTPNNNKNSKAPSAIAPASNESQEITSSNDQFLKSNETETNAVKRKINTGSGILENLCTSGDENGETSRRKRIRRKKSTRNCNGGDLKDAAEQNENLITIGSEIPSSTPFNSTKSVDESSHIYFDDSSTIVEAKYTALKTKYKKSSSMFEQKQSPKIIFKCKLSETDLAEPLVFPLKIINNTSKARKPIIHIKENILLQAVNIEDLIKENTNTDFEATKLKSTTEKSNKICDDNVSAPQRENNLEPSKNKTIPSLEISNDCTNLEGSTKQASNEVELPTDLADANVIQEPSSKVIENDSQTEQEIPNDKCESSCNVTPSNIISEPNTDKNNECYLDKQTQKDQKIKSKSTTEEVHADSSAFEESSVIDLDDDDDVIDLSDAGNEETEASTMNHSEEQLTETFNKSINKMSVTEMLPFCTPLIGIPKVGDVLIFKFNRKVLFDKIDVSEYVACKCDYVNRRTKVLKLAIIDASQENNIIPRQYASNLDESIDSDKYMNIKVAELIEAKVLET